MKAIKIIDSELYCLYNDAIFLENDMYCEITGESSRKYHVDEPRSIDEISEIGWSSLQQTLEFKLNTFKVIAGETGYGGQGFVALKNLENNSFKWLIHLSSMNNPKKVIIEKNIVRLTTDLNYPNGLDFIIPILKPELFKIQTVANS